MSEAIKGLNPVPETINLQCADIIDWNRNCFPLGIKVEGQEMPWLELDRSDLRVLELLLSKPLVTLNGREVGLHPPPMSESDALLKLAGWCRAVVAWMDGKKLSSP